MLKSILLGVIVMAAVKTACGGEPGKFYPETIVAIERAALDRWSKGDPQGFLDLYTDDVTYFDPYQKARIDGLAAMRELYAPLAGKWTVARFELTGTKVQHYSSVALLSFNLVNYDGAGNVINRWNATETYRLAGGKWKIFHSHWSYTTPALKQAGGQ